MENPKEYHYTYYSYEEWGMGYFGSRTCKCLPEEDVNYFGSFSDKNFKPKYKIILKDDYVTRAEAYVDEIILQEHYKVVENPHFANKAYQTSTKFYYTPSKEEAIKNGKKGLEKIINLRLGIHSLTTEERRENGRKSAEIAKIKKTGIYALTSEQKSEGGKKGGKIGGKEGGKVSGKMQYELGIGIHGMSFEEKSIRSKKNGLKHKENKTAVCGRSKEKMSEDGKKGGSISGNQKWKCTETGFITNAGNLTKYQKARGIDTSNRVRIF
ncbi:MAG: hypothetical protein EBS91_10535 [Betaproteobacteria bacterium]|nr:hypothetical protein [Betaproteobacteria bacterium]NCA25011.1 hypothetical protein [Betaproteobacteria bacterium]